MASEPYRSPVRRCSASPGVAVVINQITGRCSGASSAPHQSSGRSDRLRKICRCGEGGGHPAMRPDGPQGGRSKVSVTAADARPRG